MYGVLAAFLFFLLTPLTCVAAANQAPAAEARYVPDAVIVVFSGGLSSIDTISCTYNKPDVSKAEAEEDVQTLEKITQAKFDGVKITSKALPPSKDKQTSSEFQVNGFVNYNNGGLIIEPFISAFKRFQNIEIDYIINRKFKFKGLTNYDDKHVSVRLTRPYQYRVVVKNPEFTALNLPVVVAAQAAPKTAQPKKAGRSPVLIAVGIAVVAGFAVYLGARRLCKTENTTSGRGKDST